jgi:hypothetical protein
MFFKEIEGEAAVVVDNGIYRQVPLFERNGYIYVKLGGGFVRLMADGSTTKSRMRLDTISLDALSKDNLGRLCHATVAGAKPLPPATRQLLIGKVDA